MTDDNELKFIPYGIDSLGSGTKHVTRSMIIQQNKCLTDIVVIPIFGVQRDEEDKFYDNFSKYSTLQDYTRRRKITTINNHN